MECRGVFDALPSVSSLSIVITDDLEIRELNRAYRKKDKPTDVLSFSQTEGDTPYVSDSLGDVVISYETMRRQAREYGVTAKMELLRLLIHGILHLAGYDHENVRPSAAARMRRLERQLMKEYASDAG